MGIKSLEYLAVFTARALNLSSRVFLKGNSMVLLLLRDFGVYRLGPLFSILCTLADLAVSWSTRSANYFVLGTLFSNDLASIENFILHFNISELYPLLCYYEPLYLLRLQNRLSNYVSLCLLLAAVDDSPDSPVETPLSAAVTRMAEPLRRIYENGFRFCHYPGLNGFWYLFVCVVEQYSQLSYTMCLIYSNFLLGKDPRLFPVCKSRSTFVSYLPHIMRSSYLNVYFALALLFEYLYMNFKKNETVNTNFLHWATMLFLCLYVWDLKFGSLRRLRK